MMALDEMGSVIAGRAGEASDQINSSKYVTLVKEAITETQKGVLMWIDLVVVVGRK